MWNTASLMSTFFRDEILPVLIFFGMFFLIYGIGVPLFRRLPHRKGSRLAQMLSDEPEQEETEAESADVRSDSNDNNNGSGTD